MTLREEYDHLLRTLPKDLTPDELVRFTTTGFEFPSDAAAPRERQTIVKIVAVCRDGQWHGAWIIVHPFGVVGHQVFPQGRQHKADALDVADAYLQRIMDVHEAMTGVRHRGMVEDEDDTDDAPCPPTS